MWGSPHARRARLSPTCLQCLQCLLCRSHGWLHISRCCFCLPCWLLALPGLVGFFSQAGGFIPVSSWRVLRCFLCFLVFSLLACAGVLSFAVSCLAGFPLSGRVRLSLPFHGVVCYVFRGLLCSFLLGVASRAVLGRARLPSTVFCLAVSRSVFQSGWRFCLCLL